MAEPPRQTLESPTLGEGRAPAAARQLAGLTPAEARTQIIHFLRRLALLFALIIGLIAAGTIGFVLSEDVSVWRGFNWALDTVATVGSIPEPHDLGGQIVKVVLIVLGVGTLFYSLVTVTEFFVAGYLSGLLQERRMQNSIDSLANHHLVCGYGRVGRQVGRDLRASREPYVVIDTNPTSRERCAQEGTPFVEGAPSDDEILKRAGIDRASSLIACMDSDAENIFATLTARELRDDLSIVARASVEDSEKKLKRAGANRVISPYKASGAVMARLALNPQVSGVTDVMPEWRLEEIEVTSGCSGNGQKIEDIRGGSIIVAVRRDGTLLPQPAADTELAPGDVLVAMGTSGAMNRLEKVFTPAAS
ncbi:MAG: voltage-gated potassium channel [Solirubrobacterales bacterium]|nr:voltage-gated potassium channel [Solirubrobacterales bacterium]